MPAAASIYVSTRGLSPAVDFAEALLRGVAPDGGLYVPSRWPALAPEALTANTAREVAQAVLRPFVGDALPDEALTRATWRLTEGFLEPEVTPLVQIGPNLHMLELFHGPTAAFKDYAMQMAAVLAEAALKQSGQRLLLITATSGDTGAAAARAFADVEGVELVILHPLDRFTIADIVAVVGLDFARLVKYRPPEEFTHLARWLEACRARPAAKAGA